MTATTTLPGRNDLVWKANSLAADDATHWLRIPKSCRGIAIGLGWTATGTPIGTLAIEVSNHGDDSKPGAAYPIAIATNPAGTANTLILDNIATGAEYIRLTYTRTSGGSGAVFTDDSGTAGTIPKVIFRE